ncbi:apolipoprotein L6 [Nannospalax galili]|uniref:apolipoprotein L6 n=1 Tax=Nannospalax galili TaxID=1026970 RepID=UPI000819C69F|nr:apolipoprotein L6 [Nannospalax galili]
MVERRAIHPGLMTAETHPACQENHLTHEDMDLVLEQMLDQQTGEGCKSNVELQRDKDDGPLGVEEAQDGELTDEENEELQDGDLMDEERFLKQFPSWKQKQEESIRRLCALAEDIDTNHKTSTKTKVVTNSTAVVSEVMSLLGLALAPTTAGGSLMLTAAGQVLGAITQVTSVVTDVMNNSQNKRAQAQASRIAPRSDQELEDMDGEKMSYITATGEIVYKCGSTWEMVKKHIRALRQARKHPRVASAAKRLMTTGQVSARSSRQVQKAFGGTVLEMTKNARMLGGAASAFFLIQDLFNLWNDWKRLKAGERAELAEEIRSQARELEEMVSEYTHRYKRLKQKKLAGERLGNASLDRAVETQRQPPAMLRKAKPRGKQVPLRAIKQDQGGGSKAGRGHVGRLTSQRLLGV